MDAKRDLQAVALESQSCMLEDQREQLKVINETQSIICDSVAQRIVAGVKELVSEQLNLLLADNVACTETLLGKQSQLLSVNRELKDEYQTLFNNLDSTNKALLRHSKVTKATNEHTREKLCERHNGFSKISKAASDFALQQQSIAVAANSEMSGLESLNSTIIDVNSKLSSDLELYRCHVQNHDYIKARESISNLAKIESNILSLSRNEIIRKAELRIKDIEQSREDTVKKLAEKLELINSFTKLQAIELDTTAKKQFETYHETLAASMKCKEDLIETVFEPTKSQSKEHVNEIRSIIRKDGDLFKSLSSFCENNINAADEMVSNFGYNIIKMDDEVPNVPPRRKVEYSESLSSTAGKKNIYDYCVTKVDSAAPDLSLRQKTKCNKSLSSAIKKDNILGNCNIRTNEKENNPFSDISNIRIA